MPSVSSLLKSAQSTQRKIAEQQDAQVAYDWSLSAKTYGDFITYKEYLDSRRDFYGEDASKLLTLDKTITSARKAYTSNEIQRQNINIIEGTGTNESKYQKMVDLFYEAVDNGDYDLAQTLNLQLDNLSVKMQQEQIAAQEAAGRAVASASSNNYKGIKNVIKQLEDNVGYVTLPDGSEYPGLKEISNQLQDKGKFTLADGTEISPFQAAEATMKAIAQMVVNQYENAPDQDEVDNLEGKYGAGLERLWENLKFSVGGKTLTAEDVLVAKENELINNPIYNFGFEYNPTSGRREFTLRENETDRFEITRQFNPDTGAEEYKAVGIRTDANPRLLDGTVRSLDSKITNEGSFIGDNGNIQMGTQQVQTNDQQSIRRRLEAAGYAVDLNEGKIFITGKGITRRQATIQPDGSVRFFSDEGQLQELSTFNKMIDATDDKGRVVSQNGVRAKRLFGAGEIRTVDANEISPFAEASPFGTGYISQRSKEGEGYMSNLLGTNTPSPVRSASLQQRVPLSVSNRPAIMGSIGTNQNYAAMAGFAPMTTNLLQGAQDRRYQIAQEDAQKKQLLQLQAQRDATNRIQQAQALNLNQTPYYQPANRQILKPGVLAPQPKISVAAPAPQRKITNVSVAKNKSRVSVEGANRYMTIPGLSF